MKTIVVFVLAMAFAVTSPAQTNVAGGSLQPTVTTPPPSALSPQPSALNPPLSTPNSQLDTVPAPEYVLRPGDVVQIRVYQEDDLTSIVRIGRDGTITMPLIGAVAVASNSLEQATAVIHDLLEKDYLVNPQVTLTVTEYAKRRFTVLGQVQRPGTYEMPPDATVSLLQAIATAGGYTRIASARKITVQRTVGTQNQLIPLDAQAMASKKAVKPFEILPDDVIVVGEKWL